MSKETNENVNLEELDFIEDEESLPVVDFSEIQRPRVFEKATDEKQDVSFVFTLHSTSCRVTKYQQTIGGKLTIVDMYILNTEPKIYAFRNAVKQLEDFVKNNKLKLPANIRYVGRKGESFKTQYIFETVK